ncbi:EAL domain-containing protein [Sulfurimonas sp. SAG-AH-194-L11]|nr:EAL domain-containing protein [Sulfurimonas sp. SAG-AH-194-L11]MDF1876345.1 EAL domain-containing protein [Sulfurimonas sp. SAG-AH-194-L11]
MHKIFLSLFFIFYTSLSLFSQEFDDFSDTQKLYLKNTKEIKICVDPVWKPFEWIDEKGNYRGMGSEYLKLFTQRLNVKIKLHKTKNWSQTIAAIKEKKCDLLPMVGITQERKKFLNFTTEYYTAPYVIATTLNKSFIEDISQKLNKKYAVVKSSAIIDDLRRQYKNIKIVEVKDILEGLSLVNEGKVYGFINITTAISYLIQKEGFENIKIAGKLPFGFKIAIGTNKDKVILRDIFQKLINNTDKNAIETINAKGVSLLIEEVQDYTLAYQILLFFALLTLAFVYRQYLLKKLNTSLVEKIQTKTAELQELNKVLEKKVQDRTQELTHQAHYDSLTQLPNRVLFHQKLLEAINEVKDTQKFVALFFIDLDRFKEINDSFGHHIGDEILCYVANKLSAVISKEDTLARLGGDEFTVILRNLNSVEEANPVAQALLDILKEPIKHNSHLLYLSASIGISIYPTDDTDINNLIKNADAAMYKAKEDGRNNFRFYSHKLTQKAFSKVILQGELKEAIINKEFIVYYQPQIDARTDMLIGFEALVRWNHPSKGILSPFHFIKSAEETGLIIEIDQEVMTQAMKDFSSWIQKGLKPGHLSLNLETQHLAHAQYIETLKRNIKQHNFNPEWLELEVLESDVMKNADEAISKLNLIHDLGIKISIDDFGTGYSSLSYLKKLPIDKLKIDKSFIDDVPQDEEDTSIVKAIIALGNSLNLEIIAEGVETLKQKEFLLEHDCYNMQGYLYAKPMSKDDVEIYLKDKL